MELLQIRAGSFYLAIISCLILIQPCIGDINSLLTGSAALLGAPKVDDTIMNVAEVVFEIRQMVQKSWMDPEVSASLRVADEILPDGYVYSEIISETFPSINAHYEGRYEHHIHLIFFLLSFF